MKLHFTKMHGCGNDYIYIDCFRQEIRDPHALSIRLSDRHFGIGGDGIVLILPSSRADAEMRIFNRDGSEAKMCGNAIRCVGKYLYDNRITYKNTISVNTASGIRTLFIHEKDGKAESVTADMGKACFEPDKIPVRTDRKKIVSVPLSVMGREYSITCVSMGNPHCVLFFDEDLSELDLEKIGPCFENHPLFPDRINTEFIRVQDSHTLQMRVWERGSGETDACGTGACAAVSAAVINKYCPADEDITVHLRGGSLSIRYTEESVFMTGNAVKVFDGDIEIG